jgi:hypothetical protein
VNIDRLSSIGPGTAIALVALFFALGGSAFAVGERIQGAAVAQQRCTTGAVRGIVVVTGDPRAGIANLADQFTSSKAVFGRTFNCTGRGIQVRRVSIGVYEVRLVGNGAQTALASGLNGGYASADPASAGIFKVSVYPAGRSDPEDRGFVLVAL